MDFQFRYNGELMDSPTLSLEEYDIPATGIIQIEEKIFWFYCTKWAVSLQAFFTGCPQGGISR